MRMKASKDNETVQVSSCFEPTERMVENICGPVKWLLQEFFVKYY